MVSYKILNGESVTKNGIISIPNPDKDISMGSFYTLKKTTFAYFDQYDANITAMSKLVIDKLLAEL